MTLPWDDELVDAHVRSLPTITLMALRVGPINDPDRPEACRVCEVLRYPEYPNEAPGRTAHRWLVEWHGHDPVRCGVIYGMASAALLAAGRLALQEDKG